MLASLLKKIGKMMKIAESLSFLRSGMVFKSHASSKSFYASKKTFLSSTGDVLISASSKNDKTQATVDTRIRKEDLFGSAEQFRVARCQLNLDLLKCLDFSQNIPREIVSITINFI
jgi:hypothetical protein